MAITFDLAGRDHTEVITGTNNEFKGGIGTQKVSRKAEGPGYGREQGSLRVDVSQETCTKGNVT